MRLQKQIAARKVADPQKLQERAVAQELTESMLQDEELKKNYIRCVMKALFQLTGVSKI